MEHVISFPALGLELTINRVAFNVFGKDIYWYGIIICAGFILAALYVNARVKQFGVTSDNLVDCLIICVPTGIVCARIYYVIFEWEYYRQHPGEIVAIWNGGIAIYGAVIGVLIALFVYSRVKKLSYATLCDLAAFGLLIGQCIGRWGNFVNGEAHGGETGLPWGMSIDGADPVHPTFLYESLWNLAGFAALHFYANRRKFAGEIALLYIAWYGLGRAWIEGLRTDSLYLGPVRVSQVLAAVSCVAAIALLARQYHRIRVRQAFYVPEMPQPAPEGAPAAPAEDAMSQPAVETAGSASAEDSPAQSEGK
nr:prolipoprotein diacylglyceryl transferase [uncultured Agathobaculum sp.]